MEFVKNYIDFSNVLKAKDVRHGTHAHGDGISELQENSGVAVDRPFREENVPMPSAKWQEHLPPPHLNSVTSISFIFISCSSWYTPWVEFV